jgi:hypothetical protein
MAAEGRADVHNRVPHCLLELFDEAATGLADWSEFDAEAARLSIQVRGLSREHLSALIAGSTLEIPSTEHRGLHQEASDFVRWGRRGAAEPWPTTDGRNFSLLARSRWGRVELSRPLPATVPGV